MNSQYPGGINLGITAFSPHRCNQHSVWYILVAQQIYVELMSEENNLFIHAP